MILDGVLLLFQGIVNILLSPLTALNIGIDFLSGIPVVTSFLQVITYVLPWDNLMPIIIATIAIIIFKAVITLIKTIWDLLPIL